jgi:uncharacterized protein
VKSLVAAGLAFLAALALSTSSGQVAVPALKARVTDRTGTLTASQVQALEGSLREFEQRKGSQIAVLIVPTTQPEAIEQYSIRVAEAWKIGRGRVDDGVIVVVAKNDRKVRIEVGRGLEGAIPDIIASRVIREIITPHFQAGDFYGGLTEATRALMKRIEGEPLPAPRSVPQQTVEVEPEDILPFFIIIMAFIFFLGSLLAHAMGRLIAVGAASFVGAVFGWVVGIGVGLFVAIFVLFAILTFGSPFFALYAGAVRWGGGGGGGGGFSGGGGSFGGGGASGSW